MKPLPRTGKGAPPRKNKAPRWTCQQTCQFYGLTPRWWRSVRQIGEDSRTDVPWEDPAKLVDWFELMQSRGLRKHGPPPQIVEKADEAEAMEAESTRGRVQPADNAVQPALQSIIKHAPPLIAILPHPHPEEQPTDRRIELDLLRQVADLTEEERRFREAGSEREAMAIGKRLRLVREDLRKWKTSMPKMRDQAREREQRKLMGNVASALARALLRGLTRELPAHKTAVTRAWNLVADSLPGLLTEELGIEEEEKHNLSCVRRPV